MRLRTTQDNRARWHTRVAAVVIGVAVAGVLTAAGPAGEAVVTQDDLEAIRFRNDFGLAADGATIASVRSSPTSDSEMYGVPLAPDEIALMARRDEIQLGLGGHAELRRSEP